jgi:hypothetical protein
VREENESLNETLQKKRKEKEKKNDESLDGFHYLLINVIIENLNVLLSYTLCSFCI